VTLCLMAASFYVKGMGLSKAGLGRVAGNGTPARACADAAEFCYTDFVR